MTRGTGPIEMLGGQVTAPPGGTNGAKPADPASRPAPNQALGPNRGSKLKARVASLKRRPKLVAVLIAVALVAAAAATFAVRRDTGGDKALDAVAAKKIADDAIAKAIEELQGQPPRSALVYRAIVPSIVVIQAKTPASKTGVELGTGVIVNQQGAIMTAFHVIDGATSITVTFTDGTESTATVANEDPDNDIAVLTSAKNPEVIVPATLGGGVRIGDETFAVGNPFGLTGSLSAGVISGTDREVPMPNGKTIKGVIQFDAAVNPGNSGGPLLNSNGQVVGIVTGLANPNKEGLFVGIGYAVPIQTAGGAAGAPQR
ncbi:MAG: S1C family serine protease [Acidimicrobiia bacterium]